MEIPILVAAGAAAMVLAVVLVVLAALTVRRLRRSQADLEARLAAAQREVEELRHRLAELTAAPGDRVATVEPGVGGRLHAQPAEFVITQVGEPDDAEAPVAVPDRLVLSATLGEPLVRVAAFSHGVRRALSAESRNRIWFEMRREVRASRRRRRELRKRLHREYRANLRAAEDLA